MHLPGDLTPGVCQWGPVSGGRLDMGSVTSPYSGRSLDSWASRAWKRRWVQRSLVFCRWFGTPPQTKTEASGRQGKWPLGGHQQAVTVAFPLQKLVLWMCSAGTLESSGDVGLTEHPPESLRSGGVIAFRWFSLCVFLFMRQHKSCQLPGVRHEQ